MTAGHQVHHISRESRTEVTVSETEKLLFFHLCHGCVFKKKKKKGYTMDAPVWLNGAWRVRETELGPGSRKHAEERAVGQ